MRGRADEQEKMMRARGYLTYREVAAVLGLTTIAVGRRVREGALHAVAIGNRRYISRRELVAHLGPETAAALGIVAAEDGDTSTAQAKRPAGG